MFNRKEYKKNALNQLKNSWVDAVLLSAILLVISTFSLCGGLIVFSAVSGIISIAITGVFINRISSGKTISFNSFLDSLAKRWKPALLASLWKFLWLFLWSLLFFFPAVIKFYSYLMMHYVIAENPEIQTDKAMKISKILTEDHKAELFSMHLGFFGWFLLCCFTQGIGLIFLIPYVKMTELNAYYYLKQMAFAENRLSPADFK